MTDITQLEGAYAASWLPWIMIPLITYILPFPVFAILFLWIEREGGEGALNEGAFNNEVMGQEIMSREVTGQEVMGQDPSF
ncbi:MAG: photosystem I reaction center subunit VIII [Cyanobacteria bacterium J06621_11]